MAYEVEAIAPNPSSQPVQPSQVLKESRELDPYRSNPRVTVGQTDKGVQPSVQPSTSVDTKSEVKPEESAPTVTLAPAAAALARKEQKFRQQEQALKEKELALEAERAEIAELKALKAKLAAKDYSDVEKLVKYDEYTNFLIDRESATNPEQQALKKLETELEAVKKAQKDDVDKRFEAAVNERRKAVTDLVASKEEYSSIKELKAEEHVVQHILDTWEHDSIELSPEQAAKEVEELLLERAAKWANLSKVKGQTVKPLEEKATLPPLKPTIKTLTNNMTTSEIKRSVKSFSGMSDAERYAEARRRAEEKIAQGIKK